MGAMYILPKKDEREEDMPKWMQEHNREQREAEADAQADKQSQDRWGYKR